ncbi:uncharacterized protein [Tenebrio molitor]|uniref:uncharacterized protein isoform X2 n=1 Tax=Tenebrio molitor TaxID=7067 RepID=UPI0036247C6B
MANFCLGDGRRLGKALPQHKLMQNLLLSDFGRPRIEKITKATQTESRKVFSETNCCCGQLRKHDSETFVKKQAKKLEDKVNGRRMNQDYQKLMASIRERVAVGKDTWSDNSTGDGDAINFPRETRNAMSLLLLDKKRRRPPSKPIAKPTKPCVWPGVAERMDHDGEKRLIKADEIAAKITSKLSKNKLDIN